MPRSNSQSVGRVRTKFFHDKGKPFRMRCGATLDGFTLAYETYGKLNASRSNAILVFHAMTGSQHAAGINANVPGLDGRWTDEMRVVPARRWIHGSFLSSAPTTSAAATARPALRPKRVAAAGGRIFP